MSDFVDRLEDQLLQAAQRQAAHRRSPWDWLRARTPRQLAVVLATIVVAAPAVAATEPWNPVLGDGNGPPPTATHLPPLAEQLALLGVLRRPQTDADRGPRTTYALKFLGTSVSGVHVDNIRFLHATGDDVGAVLIPVARYHLGQPGVSEMVADLRRHGIKLTGADIAAIRQRIGPASNGLCLFREDFDHGQPAGGGESCFTADQVRDGQAMLGLGSVAFGLVPDGVDHLDVTLDGKTTTLPVTDNAWFLQAPSGTIPFPQRIVWRSVFGSEIKTINHDAPSRPPPTLPSTVCPTNVPCGP